MRIALIEDNVALAQAVERTLRDAGHAVDWLPDGAAADAFLRRSGADLAVVDVNLPGMNGFDVVRAMRARGDPTPVLMLTARGDTEDRVRGLDAGADDYLIKPFASEELLARVRALSRRRPDLTPAEEMLGDLRFDRKGRAVFGPEGRLDLSRRELMLFEALADQQGRIVGKSSLADSLYGTGSDVALNAVELLVSRLRRKLSGCSIEIRTARGLGYMLDTPDGRP
jgi:two-component system OmpR family response regulator